MREDFDNGYPEVPGEREWAHDEAIKAIEAWPDVPAEIKTLAKERAGVFVDWRHEQDHSDNVHYSGQIGSTRWFIKNDDLNLLGQLTPAAMAIVTFLSVANAPIAVMAFGLVFSMLGVAKKLKDKHITVDAGDYYVLMALRQAGPSTVSRISEILSGLHIYGRDVWDGVRTIAALNKLKQVPQGDGTTTALVNEASDGRWSTNGI